MKGIRAGRGHITTERKHSDESNAVRASEGGREGKVEGDGERVCGSHVNEGWRMEKRDRKRSDESGAGTAGAAGDC